MSARRYGDWWADYDRAGLKPGQEPPAELRRLAEDATLVLSSDLPRAMETAAALRRDGASETLPLFVEAPLPAPPTPLLRLKPKSWGVVSRTFWVLGYAPQVESHRKAWARAHDAARLLIDRAREDGSVLLCAHGYFNWMIDKRLRRSGWRRLSFVGDNHYWSYRTYAPRALGETASDG